jgi:hypothetical protein
LHVHGGGASRRRGQAAGVHGKQTDTFIIIIIINNNIIIICHIKPNIPMACWSLDCQEIPQQTCFLPQMKSLGMRDEQSKSLIWPLSYEITINGRIQ